MKFWTKSASTEPASLLPPSSLLPIHLGIIMDGNGRWAQRQALPRLEGHRRGLEVLRQIVQLVSDLPIPYLSVYSFSRENWSRPPSEVADLMELLKFFVRTDLKKLHAQNIRIRVLGERADLDRDIGQLIKGAEELTQHNTGLTLLVAFNYGGRQEIVAACQKIAEKIYQHQLKPSEITPELISMHLDTANIPDPDLIIRTSGEYRLSNFLPWQSVYAELAFVPHYWPDFNTELFQNILGDYAQRQRRFGNILPLSSSSEEKI